MAQEKQGKENDGINWAALGTLGLLAVAAPITAKLLMDKSKGVSKPTNTVTPKQGATSTPTPDFTPDVWYETRTKGKDYEYYAPDFSRIKHSNIPTDIYQRPSSYYSKNTGYNPTFDISYADIESPFKDNVGRNIYNTVYAKGKLEGDWWTSHIENMNKWHQGNQG